MQYAKTKKHEQELRTEKTNLKKGIKVLHDYSKNLYNAKYYSYSVLTTKNKIIYSVNLLNSIVPLQKIGRMRDAA